MSDEPPPPSGPATESAAEGAPPEPEAAVELAPPAAGPALDLPAVFESGAIAIQRFGDVLVAVKTAAMSLGALLISLLLLVSFKLSAISCALGVLAATAGLVFVASGLGSLVTLVVALAARGRPGLLLVTEEGFALHCEKDALLHVAFDDVAALRDEGASVTLTTRSGDVIRARLPGEEKARLQETARQAAALPPRPPGSGASAYPIAVAALLARRLRRIGEWRAEVTGLVGGVTSYRGVGVELEDAARVLEDGRAPAELRIGAALALSATEDTVTARRVRIAIHACPDDTLRAALAEAAYGDLDEELLAQAVHTDGERRWG